MTDLRTSDVVALAALIVRTLDLAGQSLPYEHEIDSPQLHYADEIKRRYSIYKRTEGYDFSKAAQQARVEVVTEILIKAGLCGGNL